MNDWLITLVVLAILAVLVVIAARRRWVTHPRRGTFTGMVVYHDWSNRDKQRGTEVIIERNAGAREFEEESGEPKNSGDPPPPERSAGPIDGP